jgi:hypothetical protein
MRIEPQKWNLYAYVENRPLMAIDPTGKETEIPAQEDYYDS